MLKKNINLIFCTILFILVISISILSYTQYALSNNITKDEGQAFSDVPENSYAYIPVHELRKAGVTNGIGNNRFGFGRTLSRGEFVTFLARLMNWDITEPAVASFDDNQDPGKYYYAPIETALKQGVIDTSEITFRPDDDITREEAAVMIVNCLGYGDLAETLAYLDQPFEDVFTNVGAITIARDFGIASLDTDFNPSSSILREQAAAMLIRMRDAMDRSIKELNGFYAISSYSQVDMIDDLSCVFFGWSRLSLDSKNGNIVVNTSRNEYGYNEFSIPEGFDGPLGRARQANTPALLMLYSSQDEKIQDPLTGLNIGITEYVLTNPKVYQKLIDDIIVTLKGFANDNQNSQGTKAACFDGVVIDFESLRGETLKKSLNDFLKELKAALDSENKKLFVAVHPLYHPARSSASIDGYDYKTIGEIADKVILMAHDYDAKRLTKAEMEAGFSTTPLTPIEDVYYALQAITDPVKGVQDKCKIMLQISFDWTAWKKKDGKVLEAVPGRYNLENFMKLLKSEQEIEYAYSDRYANPYIKYIDASTGVENIVWYENSQSVMEKVKLAKFFGVGGISLWRLGLIPNEPDVSAKSFDMDIWQELMKEME